MPPETPPAAKPAPTGPRGFPLAIPLALTALAYARTLSGPFVFDDVVAIVQNPAVKDLSRYGARQLLASILSGRRALTEFTFAVNYAVGRLEPWNFHLTNLGIHLAAIVLVYAFTVRVARLAGAERARGIGVAVAGIFALHPIQTEAVSYVVQRAESLASALYLGVLLLLFASERHAGTWRGRAAWAGAFFAFAAGLAAKSIVVTAPLAYLLVAAAVGGGPAGRDRVSWKARLVRAAPLLGLGALHAARLVEGFKGASDVGFGVAGLTPTTYLATQLRVLLTYLRLLAWPSGQCVDWDFPHLDGLADPRALGSAVVLAAIAAAAIAVWARAAPGGRGSSARLAALGAGWFALVLSPTSSVMPLADVLVEHRLYLPSWGFFLAATVGAERIVGRWGEEVGRRAATWGIVLLWIVLALATWRRNGVWESSEALWRDAAEKAPRSARVALALGQALRAGGRHAEAIAVYREALEHAPANLAYQSKLHSNLGAVLQLTGDADGALASFRLAAERDPGNRMARANLASALLRRGELDVADEIARRLLADHPESPEALTTMALVRLARRDPAGALALLDRVLAMDPDLGLARYQRGHANLGLGRREEACRDWREAMSGAGSAPYRFDCARALAQWCGGS